MKVEYGAYAVEGDRFTPCAVISNLLEMLAREAICWAAKRWNGRALLYDAYR
jgi:hypothetical protein